MKDLYKRIRTYLSLVKFGHTVFAMPFALIGFSLGVRETESNLNIKLLTLIILCMVFARNAAMGFNRLVDRKYDILNPRTLNREIPAGKVSPREAFLFVVINSILFILSAGLINRLTLFLAPVALLIILGYSLTKRITFLCHFILGLGLSLAPLGAYISVTGEFNFLPIIYSFIVLTWVSGFDIIYALQDEEFDRINNLHSLPSFLGKRKALIVSTIIHLITFFLIIAAGYYGKVGYIFWIGVIIFSALLTYQHMIVKSDDLTRVTTAFQTTNGYASIIFAFFAILDLFIK